MSDLEEFGQLFESPVAWIVLGVILLGALVSSHEFRDWRHRRRRRGVRLESGFYIDSGIDSDGDMRTAAGDGGDGGGGGGDGGE